ncbi:MAG: tetratricopeptide repeat protein [Bacteroidales bacterium]|nr:tetratricopeptide repeat protein [Bacteroidales bacterium]
MTVSCFARNPQADSVRAGILAETEEAYRLMDKDSMFRYCELLLHEARQTGNPMQMAQANKLMGIYWQSIQPSESLAYFRQAMEAYKSAGNKEEAVRINNMIAVTYSYMGEYDKQLLHLKKALQDVLEINNIELEIGVLHHISEAYFYLGNNGLAEEYSSMALQESRSHDHRMQDEIIHTQAKIEFRKGDYQRSIELSRDVLARARENGRKQMEITCMYTVAECLTAMKRYGEARSILEKCREMTYPGDNASHEYKTLQLTARLDSATGNFANVFRRQRQLEQLTARKHSLEQVQKTSDQALQTELQRLSMNLSDLQSKRRGQEKQAAKMDAMFLVLVFIASGGCFSLVWFRRSFKKLKLEKARLMDERAVITEKKNGLWNKHRAFLQKKESLMEPNRELIASNRSKTELFKAISHDLQTPLIRLQQNLGDLMVTNADETQFRQATAELTKMVGDISLLLENLLQWSKFQSQGIRAKPQYTEMTALVNDVISQQKFSAAEKKISIHHALKMSMFVYLDEELTKISVKAVLQNIVKLSDPDATITITGDKDRQNGWLQLNYAGQMPLKRLFLQQSQADSYGSESSELGKAISLGWMLCRTLMTANRGKIHIEDISDESFSIVLYFPLEESVSKVKV